MENDEGEDGEDGDEDEDAGEGVFAAGEGKADVHAVEGGDHRGDAEDDGQGGQKFNRFVELIGEDNLVRVAEASDTAKVDRAEIF